MGAPVPESTALESGGGGVTATADVHAGSVANCEEVLAHCRRGDYLGASLLAAGRAFAGLEDCDPGLEALLVAHHAATGSPSAPWPDWCHDQDAALEACERRPRRRV